VMGYGHELGQMSGTLCGSSPVYQR
jgi:hypothetical protein